MRIHVHDNHGRQTHETDTTPATAHAEAGTGSTAPPGTGSAAEGSSALVADIVGSTDEELWLENRDEPLGAAATVADLVDETGGSGSAHVYRGNGLITVTISYNGADQSRSFGPGSTIDRIFEWAVSEKGFNLDPAAAADLVLRLPGAEDDLDLATHIGKLVDKGETLTLHLLPATRFAG